MIVMSSDDKELMMFCLEIGNNWAKGHYTEGSSYSTRL